MQDYNIEELIGAIDFEKNKLHKTKYDIFLTTYEIDILNKYHIPYDTCTNAKQILQRIESIILDLDKEDQEELDQVSMTIAERDYYQNTNK